MSERKSRISKAERREQIIQTACALFAEKGYENTTAKDIAVKMGTSDALISQHFAGKDAIYQVLFQRWAQEEMVPVTLQIVNGSALETLKYFAEMMLFHRDLFVQLVTHRDPVLAAAVYSRGDYVRQRHEVVKKGSDIIRDTLVPIIKLGQLNGEIRDWDPVELASFYSGAVNGCAMASRDFPDTFKIPDIQLFTEILKKTEE